MRHARFSWFAVTATLTAAMVISFLRLDATGRSLAFSSAWLIGGTMALSVPLGVALAFFLGRTDLPGRRFWLALLLLQLFVPMCVHAAAWKAGFGLGGWFTALLKSRGISFVLLEGWRAAIWVHAMAALPWVVLIVAIGLRLVERQLEEEALLHASPWRVLLRVTLPRASAAAAVAALWVAVSTAAEMTATNVFRVSTLTEQLYQLLAVKEPIGAALWAILPLVFLLLLLLAATLGMVRRMAPPPRAVGGRPLLIFPLGRGRWPCAAIVGACTLALTAVPLGNLCYEAGVQRFRVGDDTVSHWSLVKCAEMTLSSPLRFSDEFGWTLQLALLAAAGAVLLALPLAWLARGGGPKAWSAWSASGLALAAPGPLIALAIIGLLNHRVEGSQLFRALVFLYDRTIFAPWLALVIKTLPWAMLVLWHGLRSVPSDVLDLAATQGAGPARRLLFVALPQRLPVVGAAALIAFALAAGDLTASNLVLPPGVETLPKRIFRLIHASVDDQVAGACLALVMMFGAVTLVSAWLLRENERIQSRPEQAQRSSGAGLKKCD